MNTLMVCICSTVLTFVEQTLLFTYVMLWSIQTNASFIKYWKMGRQGPMLNVLVHLYVDVL